MSQAIFYVDKNSTDKSGTDKNSIPTQAIAIPIGHNLDKQTLLSALAKAGSFPDYFAHNWDAAWDCLTDSDIRYLSLDLTEISSIDTDDFETFKDIIEEAYRNFGQPQLWIICANLDDNALF